MELGRQKSQNSTSTGRPSWRSRRSDATLPRSRPTGKGGAARVSTPGRAVGGDVDAAPYAETRACAHAWARPERALPATLVALYAIESAQPAIAETKRAGLRAHYGIDDAATTAYFDVHVRRDREHAASG